MKQSGRHRSTTVPLVHASEGEPNPVFPERKIMATGFPDGLHVLAPVCVAFVYVCVPGLRLGDRS